jgi:hypothetical protein
LSGVLFYCLWVVESFDFFIPSTLTIDPCLPWSPAATHFALMSSLMVVVMHPLLQVLLQDFDGFIELLTKSDLIKLIEQRLVEAFTGAVALRASGFGAIDVARRQIKLEIMLLDFTAAFGARIRSRPMPLPSKSERTRSLSRPADITGVLVVQS